MGIAQTKRGEGTENRERKMSAAGTLLWAEFSAGFASAKHVLYSKAKAQTKIEYPYQVYICTSPSWIKCT